MSLEPAMSGEIPADGVMSILRDVEARRITGRLRYTFGGEAGEVELVAGQIAMDQDPLPDGRDPVERLLALRGGIYVVHQRLPPLPVSQGDDEQKQGSLSAHAPADLMSYCESAGLTGTLRLVREGHIVEMVYEGGELLGIRVNGEENADLSHVFEWEDGRFEIRVGKDVHTLVPSAPEIEEDPADRDPTMVYVKPRRDTTGRQFLKVVEVALTDIVETRSKAKRRTAEASIAPAPVRARPRPAAQPAPKKRVREPTIRVLYLSSSDDIAASVIDSASGRAPQPSPEEQPIMAKQKKTKTKTKDAGGEAGEDESTATSSAETKEKPKVAAKAEGGAEKKAEAKKDEPKKAAPAPEPKGAANEALVSAGWALVVIAVGLGLLAILARLPT